MTKHKNFDSGAIMERPLHALGNGNGKDKAFVDRLMKNVDHGLASLKELRGVSAVVGVPFRDEDDTLPGVVRNARFGLEQARLGNKAIVLCVGPESKRAQRALDSVLAEAPEDSSVVIHGFLVDHEPEGRGFSIRAIVEAASRLGCPLILLPPDLTSPSDRTDAPGSGFSPWWIRRLLEPVLDRYQDLALARFCHHPLDVPTESLLAFPVLTGVFGLRLRQPTSGVLALSSKLLHSCRLAAPGWVADVGDYGFDSWVVAHALAGGFPICEVPLGVASLRHGVGRLQLVFHQVAHIMLNQVGNHSKFWLERSGTVASPNVLGQSIDIRAPRRKLDPGELLRRFKREFNHFDDTLFRAIVADDLRGRMKRLADGSAVRVGLNAEEWIRVVRDFLLAYRFESDFHRDDIVDGLFPFFLARLSGYVEEVRVIEDALSAGTDLTPERREEIVRHEAEILLQRQADVFVSGWPDFRREWRKREAETSPYLPQLGAWEFVPHVGVMLPQELEGQDGTTVWANKIYQKLIDRYREEFRLFLSDHLDLQEVTDSSEILSRIHRFMRRLDWTLDVDLFPGDLQTVEGAREVSTSICAEFAPEHTFQLRPEIVRSILRRTAPKNLIMQIGCGNVSGLLELFDANDALGMAAWTDRQHYLDNILDIIGQEGEPDWFHLAPVKPVVVDLDYLTGASEVRGTAGLARLAGRIMVGNYDRGWGGEFRKLWFFLKAIKSIMGVELFAQTWERFASSGIDFAQKLVASIRGHWGRCVLSAHNVFENRHQRILVKRLKQYAQNLAKQPNKAETAALLEAAASIYHLSITLPDATFVPLSAWTWASYSRRGGVGAPTPLSSLVERDWATTDFLTSYLTQAEVGDENAINETIYELMGQGRESDDLREHLLGVSEDPEDIVVRQSLVPETPQAGRLERLADGPILEPIAENKWESRYVLNAATVRIDGTVYILYRAFGEDEISRVGLAWTRDGVHIDGRLDHQIFEPGHPTESAGCEDPRVTVIGDRMYMLYTAWDRELPQIAMASIPVQAFLERRFDTWKRHGLGFPGLPNKDAVIYPETFNEQFVIYHRIDPNMWISYMDSLECPWPRTGHKIVVGPRPGMMWDGVKIGAGAQPIKTTHGWLNIYHGVDYEHSYRLGVLLMALDDPAKVLYQSPNPILEPEAEFEIGHSGGKDFWVPHVVFTCGAVPAANIDVVGPEDEIFVYYGAADTAIGVAKARLKDLVPILR